MPSAFCEGDEVYLRPVEPGDAALVARWKIDPFVCRMALDPGVETSAAAEAEAYEFSEACLHHLLAGLRFQCEGVKREAHLDGQGYCDVVVLGLLAEEFQE